MVELGVQGVFGNGSAGRDPTAHQQGVSQAQAMEQGLPEDTLSPQGRGTEVSQPPGSARRCGAAGGGQGKDRHSKRKRVYLSIPCSLPAQSVPGFQGQGYIKSDLAPLWALRALIQILPKQIQSPIFCCLQVSVTGGLWPPPPSPNLSCTDPEKPEGKG